MNGRDAPFIFSSLPNRCAIARPEKIPAIAPENAAIAFRVNPATRNMITAVKKVTVPKTTADACHPASIRGITTLNMTRQLNKKLKRALQPTQCPKTIRNRQKPANRINVHGTR